MSASDPAPPTRLIFSLPTEKHHGIVAEIRTNANGEHRISVSCWRDTADGLRQLGRSAEVPAARTSKLTALTEAVKQALGKGPPGPDVAARTGASNGSQ